MMLSIRRLERSSTALRKAMRAMPAPLSMPQLGAFSAWADTAAEARAQLILKGIEAVKKELPDLAVTLTKEQGKPVGDSQREIEHFLHGMNFYAGLASKIRGSYVPLPDNKMYGMVLKQPIGVCGAIVPWNFPITLMGTKVGPALAAGCTVVVKPASTTPLTTLRIVELLNSAGLPKGVLNVVTGPGGVVGEELLRIRKSAESHSRERAKPDNMSFPSRARR